MKKHMIAIIALWAAMACLSGAARAGELRELVITNSLDEEIVSIRVQYEMPNGEPRRTSSHVFLPPGEDWGEDWRVAVRGTLRPERILVDLATKTYDFADLDGLDPDGDMRLELDGLDPDGDMRLEVAHERGHPALYPEGADEGGHPILRRLDVGDATVRGIQRDYLTDANRPNAVNRDDLTDTTSWEEVLELVGETLAEAREELGEAREFALEAGPIWNDGNAGERCPEVVAEWNAAQGREARWTGNWNTTVPGEMSVCACVEGAAALEGTLFEEDMGWGRKLYFPVRWKKWFGVAQVVPMDEDGPDGDIYIGLSFPVPGEGAETMLEDLLDDLRVDGFRPLEYKIKTWDDEAGESNEAEFVFHEGDGDKYDDQWAMQERLFAAYADGSLRTAVAEWVTEEVFEQIRDGKMPSAAPGVAVIFSRGTFRAVFVRDWQEF